MRKLSLVLMNLYAIAGMLVIILAFACAAQLSYLEGNNYWWSVVFVLIGVGFAFMFSNDQKELIDLREEKEKWQFLEEKKTF